LSFGLKEWQVRQELLKATIPSSLSSGAADTGTRDASNDKALKAIARSSGRFTASLHFLAT
jgi:hypothetical protein